MVEIQFADSKSGTRTCIANGIRLHSAYDPVKEAERFVGTLAFDFNPSMVIVTEPALSYCSQFLRKRFPKALLVAIRFTKHFDQYNYLWDKTFHYSQIHQILSIYGEDMVLSAGFISWQPSQQVFPDAHNQCWEMIKNLVQTSRDILGTRAYFGRRWFKNTLSFCYRIRNSHTIKKGTSTIVLAASGPSLESSLDVIGKNRGRFFLIALSSGLSPLLAAGIMPDLCISTDGGYWAKKHIMRCPTVLAVPAEAAIPGQCFEGAILPLKYGDGPEGELLDACGIPSHVAARNGTVSGTALELALSITSGPVFACGLDLCHHSGFQHCQPNQLEVSNLQLDRRLAPKETRLYPQQLPSKSLEIYAQWFQNQSQRFCQRFYRLATEDYHFSNRLGHIQDIDWKEFDTIISQWEKDLGCPPTHPEICREKIPGAVSRCKTLKEMLLKYKEQGLPDTWLAAILPAELALRNRSTDKGEIQGKIREKSSAFLEDMILYLDRMGEQDAL